MALKDEFRKMVIDLTAKFSLPSISDIFFPPFQKGGQRKDSQFMAVSLEGGAAGISFVLLPDEKLEVYNAMNPSSFIGKNPKEFALEFGSDDPVMEMISLAAINAICQHVMRKTDFPVDDATDSLGLVTVSPEDRIGMVGLFSGIVRKIEKVGAGLVVIEKKEELIGKFPDLPITLDPSELSTCNKILCTSTTILNNSLDEILDHSTPDAFISIIGPTAGYLPDPLFKRGVDVVGGRIVKDGPQFLQTLRERKRWGELTQRTCFQKANYTGIRT